MKATGNSEFLLTRCRVPWRRACGFLSPRSEFPRSQTSHKRELTSASMVEATSAANRMLSMRPSISSEERSERTMPLNSGPVAIEFQDVWFTYAGRDIPVIKGISLKVSGATTGIEYTSLSANPS